MLLVPMESVPHELERLVSSFNAMLARLEDSFVRLSNFSADIAHELRTPISNLRTHTEVILTKKRAPEDYEENLYSNLEDLNRLFGIIDGMLFLAKSDNGLVLPAKEKIELRSVVEKLFEYYQLLADDTGVKLQVSGHGAVYGDRTMLDRTISNLLSNALRYTPPDCTISVKIESLGTLFMRALGKRSAQACRMSARRAETWLAAARFTTALRQRRHATTAAQLQPT